MSKVDLRSLIVSSSALNDSALTIPFIDGRLSMLNDDLRDDGDDADSGDLSDSN